MLIVADSFHQAVDLFHEFAEQKYGSGYDRYSYNKIGNKFSIKAGRDLYYLLPIKSNSIEMIDNGI